MGDGFGNAAAFSGVSRFPGRVPQEKVEEYEKILTS
jgi:hypothetical protein